MVYGACLENKSAERPHRFESCILRKTAVRGLPTAVYFIPVVVRDKGGTFTAVLRHKNSRPKAAVKGRMGYSGGSKNFVLTAMMMVTISSANANIPISIQL